MKTASATFQTVIAAEIFAAYCDHLVTTGKEKDIEHIRTALLRFTVPGWSNRYPVGRKSTAAEVAQSLTYLKRVSVEQLQDALAVQAIVFDHLQIDKERRRYPRCVLNKMLQWAESQGYFGCIAAEVTAPVTQAPTRLLSPKGSRRLGTWNVKVGGKPTQKPYALGTHADDDINEILQTQLKELADFLRSKGLREITIKATRHTVEGFLGWLHRRRGVALGDLRLESIVPFIPLRPCREDFRSLDGPNKGRIDRTALAAAKMDLDDDAKEAASEAIRIIEMYFKWLSNHPSSDGIVLKALVNVAKYLYRDQTDKTIARDYQDVPIILRLRNAHAAKASIAKQVPPTVPHACKSIPWADVYPVVLKVQAEADLRHRPCDGKPLSERTIAKNIQHLLILLLFVAYPVDRSRTIYELEVGRTLLFGQYKNGVFVPAEPMPKPNQAVWYLHLQPGDTKTGKTFGETWDRLDDTPVGYLSDGKTLYYYLGLWLAQYRAVFKPTHPCLLTSAIGKPLDSEGLGKRVRDIFIKHTGVPVTPKELRKMYITGMKDSGASEAVLEGVAVRMRHSRAMQSKVYDQQTRVNKVAPALDFNKQMMREAFQPKKP